MKLHQRILEPELMNDSAQAEAYATTDFSEPHQSFVTQFQRLFPHFDNRTVLDLGCGSADVTTRFARAYLGVQITGVDGADAMLDQGRRLVRTLELDDRITLEKVLLPDETLLAQRFAAVISNSLLHHLHEPQVIWQVVRACASPGAPIFIMDLLRPEDTDTAMSLVELHAGDAPELLKNDFHCSLLAAFRPREVEEQLARAGLAHLNIEEISDRHLLVWGVGAEQE